MSVEEKIRRAEEIYNRRNGNNGTYKYYSKEKKKPGLIRRMIKQIVICFIIYAFFYVGTNREYFLSDEFQNQVEEIASQSEILENGYNWIKEYWNKYFNSHKEENEANIDKNEVNDVQTENEQNVDNDIGNLEKSDENIGGSSEEGLEVVEEAKETVENTEKTQEEIDIQEIKNTISFINPINGTISSTFGWRTPTTATVPKYHTGLDIAAATGTVIKSATDGKVILVSSQGDYGKHYKIQINDVIIIYAHCSKLYLNEGDEVKQGQEIAEVGSTGNSTGPHLHFEIRKQDRLVDPQLILNI